MTKADAVWERLDVDPEAVNRHPKVTPLLIKSLGSIKEVIDCLRGSSEKDALELVRLWDSCKPNERKAVPFEGFCLAAKSTPKKMVGIIMQTMVEMSNTASELLLASAHTDVVRQTIKLAKTRKGHDERKIILQNRGVLPTPRNNVFNNFGSVNQDNRKQVANVSVSQLEQDNDDISVAVESFNAERTAKALLPDKAEVIDIVLED